MEKVITCIIQRGKGDRVVKSAIEAGAQGATVFYARGTGVRQKLGFMGALISPEKEVVIVVAPAEKADGIFDAMVRAGGLDKPGHGFAFVYAAEKSMGFVG